MRRWLIAWVLLLFYFSHHFGVSLGGGWARDLLPNPTLSVDADSDGLPDGWDHPRPGAIPGVKRSGFAWLRPKGGGPGALVVTAGEDGRAYWEAWTSPIEPHKRYRMEVFVYRSTFEQGVFPSIEVFGHKIVLDEQCVARSYQRIFVDVPSGAFRGSTPVRLRVDHPGATFLFAWPSLRPSPPEAPARPPINESPDEGAFPVGIFGAHIEDLREIREAGFNAVQTYVSGPGKARDFLYRCAGLGLGCLIRTPWEPKGIEPFVRTTKGFFREHPGARVWFYINDEPEIRSVPPSQLAEVRRRLLDAFPGKRCATAMVRAHRVPYYQRAAELFLIDPYPIPNMPLTWLSDSLDEAISYVGAQRVWAVIQAFGGEGSLKCLWPRRPTLEEMRALSFLALAHGAMGLFFFSYPQAHRDPSAWRDLRHVLRDIKLLGKWLRRPNVGKGGFRVEMTSAFRADARGRPAIHIGVKERPLTLLRRPYTFDAPREVLCVAVNVTSHPVAGTIHGWPLTAERVTELQSGKTLAVVDGKVSIQLPPYGVAALEAACPRLSSARPGCGGP